MKKIILFAVYLFFTHITLAQSERDFKVQKRVERDTPMNRTPRPSSGSPSPYIGPGWDPYRPYYGSYQPWYNNRYYRNSFYYGTVPVAMSRSRPNRQNDIMFGIGIVSTIMVDEPSTVGVRMMIGGKYIYLFGNYQYSKMNPHSHYDNITLENVISWNDYFRETVTTNVNWDLGIGMRINKKLYPTVSVGNNKVREYLVYYDDYRVLSENGLYSINGGEKDLFSLTAGVDLHLNKFVVLNTALGIAGPARLTIGGMIKFK